MGIKSREVYEAPAAVILHYAHRELERLVLDKPTTRYKELIAQEYADLIYNGLWFSPLRKSFDAFVNETQKNVTGIVRVKLFKGSVTVAGRKSPHSLYDMKLATYTKEDQYDHSASEGFIKIYGLPLKTYYKVNRKELRKRKLLLRRRRK